jgi:hypothetical protein
MFKHKYSVIKLVLDTKKSRFLFGNNILFINIRSPELLCIPLNISHGVSCHRAIT